MDAMSRIAAAVPWRVWRLTAGGVALASMAMHWRRSVLANVRHVQPELDRSPMKSWTIGAEEIATHLLTLVAAIRGIDHLRADDVTVEGWEHLEPLLASRGIVVVAPHCGSYPALGMAIVKRLRDSGFDPDISSMLRLFQPFGSHAVIDWFGRRLESQGLTVMATDEAPTTIAKQLLRTLRRHGIVILFVDEPSDAAALPVPFFDAQIRMPVGPARLARASGAVILPCCATFEPGERHHLTIGAPIEPAACDQSTLSSIAGAIEPIVRRHLRQWSMLTPIWERREQPGMGIADLHLHTRASDGLLETSDWVAAMAKRNVDVIAITDHDHLATVARDKQRKIGGSERIIPGVEVTARGRVVHVGVLFPAALPDRLIPPGRPISEVVRWARQVPGSVVVLVHPLPLLWRYQLWRLQHDKLLPDAIEVAFPLAGWRGASIERAARRLNLARLGGSDGHLSTRQLGSFGTRFPGTTTEDLIEAIRRRTTEPVYPDVESGKPAIPLKVYVRQCAYSWLYPFRRYAAVSRLRQRIIGGSPPISRSYVRTHVRTSTPGTLPDG
ncbi:MAG TPA: PHP-associated domain-containing protein [Thermomicrobiaceae bacterium]|nr:PHP-associated domain-containing protein [Thermomicrobiaceae bacterium]